MAKKSKDLSKHAGLSAESATAVVLGTKLGLSWALSYALSRTIVAKPPSLMKCNTTPSERPCA
jgi:hypothetical protein